jgi:hypothetical protein
MREEGRSLNVSFYKPACLRTLHAQGLSLPLISMLKIRWWSVSFKLHSEDGNPFVLQLWGGACPNGRAPQCAVPAAHLQAARDDRGASSGCAAGALLGS